MKLSYDVDAEYLVKSNFAGATALKSVTSEVIISSHVSSSTVLRLVDFWHNILVHIVMNTVAFFTIICSFIQSIPRVGLTGP